ncbi:MAG: undecaprenyl-diphosphatase UppP [Clostridia bacterium]|nr:undecaprenyl-diphosphatase UppP [Clostridia bacterium]
MPAYQAIILGIVQGLTEFLPISSSAHLNLFPWVLGWGEMPESFDVALHIGTLLAIVIFFFKDWIKLFIGGYKQVVKKEKTTEGKIFWYLVISTIPAGILSLVLDKISEKLFENNLDLEMIVIAITLIVMGIILYVVDKKAKSKTKYEDMTLKQSVAIGTSQALAAAFPGVSRSGITMTVARALGIDRESAARYSFLLATPITAAAVIFDLKDFIFTDLSLWLGILSSFVVGIIIIKFLLEYLKKGSFKVFAIYRVLIGIAVILFVVL